MTREFNKQRRDNSRPQSRNYAPRTGSQERPQYAPRPRVSRASMDRGWESGAQQQHADYRPRSTNDRPRYSSRGTQPPSSNSSGNGFQRNSQPYRQAGPSSFGDSQRGNSRPGYGNRSESYQEGEYGRPGKPRRYGSNQERRDFNERRPDHPRSNYRDQAPRSRSRQYGDERSPYSRYGERYEGDYERFDDQPNQRQGRQQGRFPRAGAPKRWERDDERFQKPERHVTRMPDGRVLKGPRPVQRQQAQFWNNIAEETSELVQEERPVQQPESEQPTKEARKSPASKPVKRSTKAEKGEIRAPYQGKKAGPGLRPSQHGFKWDNA